jgi:hypothetical protein
MQTNIHSKRSKLCLDKALKHLYSGISKRNQNLTMIICLLHKIVKILISYFGQIEDESIEIFLS